VRACVGVPVGATGSVGEEALGDEGGGDKDGAGGEPEGEEGGGDAVGAGSGRAEMKGEYRGDGEEEEYERYEERGGMPGTERCGECTSARRGAAPLGLFRSWGG